MREPRVVVLDASVGVKWIKPEPGRDQALALLRAHRRGEVALVVPALFVLEVVAVAVKRGGTQFGRGTWTALADARLTQFGLDRELADAAFDQCEKLGCSFYDALAPALAAELGAQLCSADGRAHGAFPGVALL